MVRIYRHGELPGVAVEAPSPGILDDCMGKCSQKHAVTDKPSSDR